ncbi:hypothetical protein [Thalassomonas actiniarum]|uniref:Uncharacterized protein n=1 Tax=Thalassomonas actiniarum TaxID=485447 RepID=A0AAE9YS05_9GAMM|nr:hypothetical protein [Thalassomonas actiniarum]WDD99209.1 hypothetical protein SG35_000520 [Thalassomonas actiniarum]
MSKLTLRKPFASPATKIYLFNFLNESESGVVRRLQEDMLIAANFSSAEGKSSSEIIQVFDISNLDQCYSAVLMVSRDAEMGQLPLIHLQGHGARDKGLKCTNGSFIPWATLIDLFEKVIYSSRGQLTVIAAACYSFELTTQLEPYGKLPYAFYYGYDRAISLGEMEQDLSSLYRNFIVNKADISGSPLAIKVHSEYDNLEAVRGALLVLINPEQARKEGLSKSALKKKLDLDLPASQARKLFDQIVQSRGLVIMVINNMFHPTERRKFILEDVLEYCNGMIPDKESNEGLSG